MPWYFHILPGVPSPHSQGDLHDIKNFLLPMKRGLGKTCQKGFVLSPGTDLKQKISNARAHVVMRILRKILTLKY